MNTQMNYMSSEQVCHIWTLFHPSTIRFLAQDGQIPVACWVGQEPGFSRDTQTIRALVELARSYGIRKHSTSH